jgi:hypothetical protein
MTFAWRRNLRKSSKTSDTAVGVSAEIQVQRPVNVSKGRNLLDIIWFTSSIFPTVMLKVF